MNVESLIKETIRLEKSAWVSLRRSFKSATSKAGAFRGRKKEQVLELIQDRGFNLTRHRSDMLRWLRYDNIELPPKIRKSKTAKKHKPEEIKDMLHSEMKRHPKYHEWIFHQNHLDK